MHKLSWSTWQIKLCYFLLTMPLLKAVLEIQKWIWKINDPGDTGKSITKNVFFFSLIVFIFKKLYFWENDYFGTNLLYSTNSLLSDDLWNNFCRRPEWLSINNRPSLKYYFFWWINRQQNRREGNASKHFVFVPERGLNTSNKSQSGGLSLLTNSLHRITSCICMLLNYC